MIRLHYNLNQLAAKWSQNACQAVVKQISTAAYPLQVKSSPVLWAEPLKAKKKVDPMILKAREEKRKRKIEKQIRKLEKVTKELKPIFENEIPFALISEKKRRSRNIEVPVEVTEERIKVLKLWSKTRSQDIRSDFCTMNRLIYSQQKALNELRLESEELYQAAVQIDQNLIPFKYKGPSETPPIHNYPSPDGEYFDVSRKWE